MAESQAQIPRGSSKLTCPFHHKTMSQVCHKCPLWVQLRGTSANTGEPVDEWRCSFTWLPMLLIEVGQQTRQAGAAIESFRNETVKTETARNGMLQQFIETKVNKRMIE